MKTWIYIQAVGGACAGLCAGPEIGIDEAEKVRPRNTCALIKSFMGFKLAGLCFYMQASDLVVGETTCDGKKKAYEILNDYKETYVMEIPEMKTERENRRQPKRDPTNPCLRLPDGGAELEGSFHH